MLTNIALVSLVITSGLLAGFFFAYWCSVMLGLRNVRDDVFVETMQNINAVLPLRDSVFRPGDSGCGRLVAHIF